MEHNLYDSISASLTVNPGAKTADVTGTGVDLAGYETAVCHLQSGTKTDGTHTPKLQESSDNSTFTDVAAADLEGSFTAVASNAVQVVGYKGSSRYIRLFVTVAGATTGAVYGASIVKGRARHNPAGVA